MPSGSVHVYLTTSNAHVIGSMHVAKAAQVRNLMRLLTDVTKIHQRSRANVLVQPTSTTKEPELKSDELLLHVKSQFQDQRTSYVDDWVVLTPREWQQFVQSPSDASQTEWSVDNDLAEKILIHLYPYAADWDLHLDEIEIANIDLRVLPNRFPRTLAIGGTIKRIQNRHPGKTPEPIRVEIAGVAMLSANGRPEITITTFKAQYGRRIFDGLVNTIAPDATRPVEKR